MCIRSLDTKADRDLTCPVQWTGQQAVVTFPQHIDISNVGQIREQLLWIINRGAAVLIADLTGTVSCDCSGADALARAQHRAVANGTELRLAVTANAVRRVLTLNGFGLAESRSTRTWTQPPQEPGEQRTRNADDPARTEELLDGAVAGLFTVGLVLQVASTCPGTSPRSALPRPCAGSMRLSGKSVITCSLDAARVPSLVWPGFLPDMSWSIQRSPETARSCCKGAGCKRRMQCRPPRPALGRYWSGTLFFCAAPAATA